MARLLSTLSLWFAMSLLGAASSASAGDCETARFHFVDDGTTPTTMSVRRGTACQFHFENEKSTKGLAGILSSNVTLRPKNGILGSNTVRIYVYKPNEAFAGNDEFEVKINYNPDNGTGEHSTLLHVSVTVY